MNCPDTLCPAISISSTRREFATGAAVGKMKFLSNPQDFPAFMKKYYINRYSLFSKYDSGILMDHGIIMILKLESWFSVTPEKIAAHITSKVPSQVKIIVDAFCGCGGNTIQFARQYKVIAIDIDPVKIEAAKNNAIIYNVLDNITFICGDVFQVLPTLDKIDLIFASVPWGGPSYSKQDQINIDDLPISTTSLNKSFKQKTDLVIFFMPRNINVQEMISLRRNRLSRLEIEETWLNDRLKNLTFYYF
jgi:trimethylguanosine synthase